MANRYWVGGTASWDGTAGTKWALTSGGAGGQAVPTSADDVFFDANSGANTITIATGNTGCKSLTCTGFTGTLTDSATLTISGGFTLAAGMTFTCTNRWTIAGTGTLTSAGKTLPPLSINGTGITVTQGDAFAFTGTPATNAYCLTVFAGTYTTNNFNITWTGSSSSNAGGGISVSGSSARTLTLGSSTITFTMQSSNNIDFFNATTTTNLTFNANTSTITCVNNSGSVNVTNAGFIGGGLTFNNVTLQNLNGGYISSTFNYYSIPISGANTFANLTLTGRTTAGTGYYTLAANQTVTGTFTASAGTDASYRSFLASNTFGTARTITCAAVSLTDIDFRDITMAGAASPASGTRLGDCGGNTNITFPAPKSVYWNLSGAQNWNAVGWAPSSGGTPASTNFPLPQDTAVFDNTGSVTGTITVNGNWNLGTMDMSNRTSAMTLNIASPNTFFMYGDWKNGSGTTLSGSNSYLTFVGSSNSNITSSGKTFTQAIAVAKTSASVILQDAFTCSSSNFNLYTGTFNANNFNVTLSSTNNNFSISGTGTRTLAMGTGTWTLASSTWNATTTTNLTVTGTCTVSMTRSAAKTFTGGSFNYSGLTLNQGGAGALTISGSNTFADISNTYGSTGATTITFTAGTTQTVSSFSASGTAGKLLTINSTVSGTQATLSKASGTVNASYLSLKDSNATGGATWNALNSTNVSGNTGWIFSTLATSGLLMFF